MERVQTFTWGEDNLIGAAAAGRCKSESKALCRSCCIQCGSILRSDLHM